MLSDIKHPQLKAIITEANENRETDVTWPDGECLRVRYDTFFTEEDNDDGIEEWVVDVIVALVPGKRSLQYLKPGHPGLIRGDDPPNLVKKSPLKGIGYLR